VSFGEKDTLARGGGHGSLREVGTGAGEIGRWEYPGFSCGFGPGGAQWGSTRETSQEGGLGRAGEGCPGKGLALEVGLPGAG